MSSSGNKNGKMQPDSRHSTLRKNSFAFHVPWLCVCVCVWAKFCLVVFTIDRDACFAGAEANFVAILPTNPHTLAPSKRALAMETCVVCYLTVDFLPLMKCGYKCNFTFFTKSILSVDARPRLKTQTPNSGTATPKLGTLWKIISYLLFIS